MLWRVQAESRHGRVAEAERRDAWLGDARTVLQRTIGLGLDGVEVLWRVRTESRHADSLKRSAVRRGWVMRARYSREQSDLVWTECCGAYEPSTAAAESLK